VVIKYLHHTTDLDDIKNELRILGHEVRNIINVKHRQTKGPLNIFFIDLEPAKNNKDIYEVKAIQNKIVHIEPPRSTKPHIPQCVRCQQYGHTRKYFNKPFNCVKCEGPHNSATCTKPRDSPAKCALCGGPHPANYKECEQYHNILKGYNPHRLVSINRSLPPSQEQLPHLHTTLSQHNNNKSDAAMRKWPITTLHLTTNKPQFSKSSSANLGDYSHSLYNKAE
jgi:hypothetical protein